MIADLSPGLILIGGGLLLPLLPRAVRGWWMLLLPVLAFAHLVGLPTGNHGIMTLSGLELTTLRIDSLSRIFGYIFLIAAALTAIYALHDRDVVQPVAGFAYAGAHLQPQISQVLSHNARRAHFLKAQLRVGMKIAPPGHELGKERFGFLF